MLKITWENFSKYIMLNRKLTLNFRAVTDFGINSIFGGVLKNCSTNASRDVDSMREDACRAAVNTVL